MRLVPFSSRQAFLAHKYRIQRNVIIGWELPILASSMTPSIDKRGLRNARTCPNTPVNHLLSQFFTLGYEVWTFEFLENWV